MQIKKGSLFLKIVPFLVYEIFRQYLETQFLVFNFYYSMCLISQANIEKRPMSVLMGPYGTK